MRPGEAVDERPRRGGQVERNLVCARCRSAVTVPSARARVAGGHLHTFANPHGFVYHIACFSEAPGARPIGSPSQEFPWFAGFTWQVDLCARCGWHLGWFFDSRDKSFHGLIADRLDEDEAGQPAGDP